MKNLPELRFPEFLDDGEWEEKKLSSIYTFKVTNSFSRDKLNYVSGLVKNIHYGDIHTKFSTLFDIKKENVPFINSSISLEKIKNDCYCQESDIVFADASEDLADVGKSIEIISLNNEKLLSGLHTLLARQKENKFITGFGGYLFKSNKIREQIKKESQGAKVLGISGTRLSNIDISFPLDKCEQQKIADCLTSVDNLITAQSKKIEALKEHKKGLMQQLFPQDEEEVPKLRFPEFKNAPKWEEKILGKICDYWNGGSHENAVTENGQYYLISLNSLDIEGNLKTEMKKVNYLDNSLQKNDLVMVLSDVAHGNFLGLAAIIPNDNYVLNQRMAGLRKKENEKIIIEFLRISINNNQKYFKKHGQGSSQLNLSKGSVTDFPVLVPSTEEEQQKIAECLSSIDELITSSSKKVETLNEHKKGLMQQLFPSKEVK